jgi:lactate racemase
MTQHKVSLPYGKQTVEVLIPEANLIGAYSPKDIAPVADIKAEVRRALAKPIGSASLQDLVRGKQKVVFVADDNTRLTPTDQLIPILLDECNQAGVSDAQITIVIALGTHRFMTEGEILAKFGAETVRRVQIKNHPYKDESAMVDLGVTDTGGRI